MAEFEAALAIISAHPELADFVGPREPQLIEKAEQALGVIFPPTYRAFARRLGAGSFGSFEVYGVIDDNFQHSTIPNGIWATLRAREDWPLPAPMLVVYNDGMTGYLVIDSSRVGADGENPVVSWYPGRMFGRTPESVARDFGSFFLEYIRDELSFISGTTRQH